MSAKHHEYQPIREVARLLRVPAKWLLNEARGGRVPSLRASRRWLAKPADVEAVLDARAKQGANSTSSAGGVA